MVDGVTPYVGGAGSGSMYSAYLPEVNNRLAVPSPLAMSSTYIMVDDEIIFDTTIEVDAAVSGNNNQLHFFICQDDLHSNPNMVVDILPSESFTMDTAGQSTSFQKSFTMKSGWSQPRLTLVLMVQDMDTGEIIQATKSQPDYAATVNIASDPPGVQAPWHLTGPGGEAIGTGALQVSFFLAGTYTVTWADVPYWTGPTENPMVLTVLEDETIDFQGLYTDGPFEHTIEGPVGHSGSGQAVNLIDFDGDGDLDIHVVNHGSPNQLLRNDNGDCVDVSGGLIAGNGSGRGAAWADFNGDGHLDVHLTNYDATNEILIGDGAGNFSLANTPGADDAGPATAASWADFNLDGNLDLYVANFGEANLLLKNLGERGGGYFVFTSESGDFEDIGNGNAACWTDCALDGRLDLFVVNQFNPCRLFQNTSYGFSDMTALSGVGNQGNGKGAAWGDYDNDGDFDLYLANEGTADMLYRASTPFRFSRVGGTNLGDTGGSRGVVWVDLNNDMFLDLYVTRFLEPDLMLIGDGAGNFLNAVACGDLDGDGRIDIYVTRDGQTNVMFSNDIDEGNRWFQLSLVGQGANTNAIGARVVVSADGVSQSRIVSSGSGYLCGSELTMHFGMADETTIDQLDIFWPDGTHQVVGPAATNIKLTLTQGENPVSPVGPTELPRRTALGRAYPNPFNPMTNIEFALGQNGRVTLDVFTLDGRHVKTLVARDLKAGPHRATWDGTDDAGRRTASGAYFYRLMAPGGFQETGRVVMVK